MAIGRISTYSSFFSTLNNVNRVQTELYDLQNQISSGLKTDNFKGMTGQVEQFVQLEAKISRATSFQENNTVNITRLQTTKVALDQVIEIADDMEDLMTLRRNGALEDDLAFEAQMNGFINAMALELNANIEGRFLFGGTRTDVQPVITDPEVPEPIEFGTLDIGYYQGSQENYSLRADENLLTEVNVRADNEAFQKIFHAAYWSINGHGEDDDDQLVSSIDMIQEGMDQVVEVISVVDADILQLENINQRHQQLELYFRGVAEQISKTDLLAASTQLAVDETILQASFSAFATINALRLSDYL